MNKQKFKYGDSHYFNVGVAQKYGVEEAIIIQNLHHWIEKNEANERHFHDGRYWSYNSVKAFSDLFPYWNSRHIARLLIKMEQDGIILAGNYNKNPYDRTKWYALTDSVLSIYQKWEMEKPEVSNGDTGSDQPIPDSKPDINTDSKPNKEKEEKESERIVDVSYNESSHESSDAPHQTKTFMPPTVEEVEAYCKERSNHVDPQKFIDFYETNGWVQGKSRKPIKSWKACVRTWEGQDKDSYVSADHTKQQSAGGDNLW